MGMGVFTNKDSEATNHWHLCTPSMCKKGLNWKSNVQSFINSGFWDCGEKLLMSLAKLSTHRLPIKQTPN